MRHKKSWLTNSSYRVLVDELLLQSPNVLTVLKRDGVLVGVVAGVRSAGWGAKKVGVKVCLVVGGDDRGLIEGLVWL
jgi:hypothetical protein